MIQITFQEEEKEEEEKKLEFHRPKGPLLNQMILRPGVFKSETECGILSPSEMASIQQLFVMSIHVKGVKMASKVSDLLRIWRWYAQKKIGQFLSNLGKCSKNPVTENVRDRGGGYPPFPLTFFR